MTALTFTIERNRVRLATDGLVWGVQSKAVCTERSAKAWPLPHYHALLTSSGSIWVALKVSEHINQGQAGTTFDEMVSDAFGIWQEQSARHAALCADAGIEPMGEGDLFILGYSPAAGRYVGRLFFGESDRTEPVKLGDGWYMQTTMGQRLPLPVPRALDWRHHLNIMAAYETRQPAERASHVGGDAVYYAVDREGFTIRRLGLVEPDPDGLDRFLTTGAAAVQKPGRNEPCPCGSGRKAKRCCHK